MNININGLSIGTTREIVLRPPVKGLAMAPIRTSSGNFSGRDGGYVSAQFFAPREIVIDGVVSGLTCNEAFAVRCSMLDKLPIRQSLPLRVNTDDGRSYAADVYLLDFQMDYSTPRYAPFQMSLLAPDPYFYDPGTSGDPNSGYINQTVYKIIGGGYINPYILPVIWDPGTTPTIINNPTDLYIYPQIILNGQFTNPQILNVTTGQKVKLNVTTTSGDKIIIDMKERTVTLNGGSILPFRTSDSSWWALVPGNNTIQLTSDSGADNTQATIRYRLAYTGVFGALC